MAPFPDAEQVAQDMLTDLGWACKWLPKELIEHLPVIMVTRVGGTDDGVTDRAEIQVDVWHVDRSQAWALASRVRERVREFGYGGMVGDIYVDQAVLIQAGQQIPTEDPDDRVVTQLVRLDMRPPL